MKKYFFIALTLLLSFGNSLSLRADEGMWLFTQLAKKYKEMKQRGLKLSEYDIYNPNGTSLKDAVVIFGGGCTGEVISNQGLVLTNHHCGYGAIQALSSVEANYLEDGYWAQSFDQELPTKDLTVTFIDKIEDVTAYVKSELEQMADRVEWDYFSPKVLNKLAKKRAGKLPFGTEVEILPFYNGNMYLMFTKKVYSDIRFVGAPPSAIGKFGADTDNWMYPRHSGDFSIFRIYADKDGNPAPYKTSNQPLKPKRWLNISTQGIEENDFAMVMGFPGRTYHFYQPEEVDAWKNLDNDIRIQVRDIRQKVMLKEMLADPKINIQYAAKYASSQNGYKRAIGANWGIEKRGLMAMKRDVRDSLLNWAKTEDKSNYQRYLKSTEDIKASVLKEQNLTRRANYLKEVVLYGIEFWEIPTILMSSKEKQETFWKDYSPMVDKKVSKALLELYVQEVPESAQPEVIKNAVATYGSIDKYIDTLFASSRYLNPNAEVSVEGVDMVDEFFEGVITEYRYLKNQLNEIDNTKLPARRTYVEGLLKQNGLENVWSDANFTLRFTFGNIKGYKPKDGVQYHHQTYLSGVMAKKDSTSWEFNVPKRLEEIYKTKNYGKNNRWAVQDKETKAWKMPVNFIATTHTTGGNSGSPVLNAKGELIGINFDRNWEGVAGDVQYLPNYQRSIICDIRYILMIVEEYGRCPRLIEEMSLTK